MKKTKRIAAALVAAVTLMTAVPELMPDAAPSLSVVSYAASKLAAPKGFKAKSTSKTSVTLTWDKVKGADAYRLFMYNEKNGKFETYDTVRSTTYTVEDLSAGKTYKFQVAAVVKKNGKYTLQKKSSKLSVKTKGGGEITAPANITVMVADTAVKISWDAVSGASAYRVYIYDPSTKTFETYKNVTETTCIIDGLQPGTQYAFQLATLTGKKGKYKVKKKSDAFSASTSSGNAAAARASFIAPSGGATLSQIQQNCNVYDMQKTSTTDYGEMYTGYTMYSGFEANVVFNFNKKGMLSMFFVFIPTDSKQFESFLSACKDAMGDNCNISYTEEKYTQYTWMYEEGQVSLYYDTANKYTTFNYVFYKYLNSVQDL